MLFASKIVLILILILIFLDYFCIIGHFDISTLFVMKNGSFIYWTMKSRPNYGIELHHYRTFIYNV